VFKEFGYVSLVGRVLGVGPSGRLLQGGQPVSPPPKPASYEGPEVIFFSAVESTPLADTTVYPDAAGNFRVDYSGGGVPPGKYKVAVQVRNGDPESDTLQGKLSRQNTTIEFDIPQDKLGSTHDIGVIELSSHVK